MSEDWALIETTTEYRCPWCSAGYDLLETPDGPIERYYWIDRVANSVGPILPDTAGTPARILRHSQVLGSDTQTHSAGNLVER